MEHKSPTDEEYGIQLKEMITPSLPSDRDRFVDYMDKSLAYKKIVYPNFFRITLGSTELNYPSAQKKIKALLDAKSIEIALLTSAKNTTTSAAPVSSKDIMEILEKIGGISVPKTSGDNSTTAVVGSNGNILRILEKLKGISNEELVGGTTETATPNSDDNLLNILDRIKNISSEGKVGSSGIGGTIDLYQILATDTKALNATIE